MARFQILKCNKKLCCQSTVLPVANKINKSTRVFFELLCFLISVNIPFSVVGFFWRCFKQVNELAL